MRDAAVAITVSGGIQSSINASNTQGKRIVIFIIYNRNYDQYLSH